MRKAGVRNMSSPKRQFLHMIHRIERFQLAIRYLMALQRHTYKVPKEMFSQDAAKPRRSRRVFIPLDYPARHRNRRRRFLFALRLAQLHGQPTVRNGRERDEYH